MHNVLQNLAFLRLYAMPYSQSEMCVRYFRRFIHFVLLPDLTILRDWTKMYILSPDALSPGHRSCPAVFAFGHCPVCPEFIKNIVVSTSSSVCESLSQEEHVLQPRRNPDGYNLQLVISSSGNCPRLHRRTLTSTPAACLLP